MSVPLSVTIFLPLAAGLLGAVLPRGWARWCVLAATVAVLVLAVWMVGDYPSGGVGLRNVTNEQWIPELGIRYQLGVDGLNVFLIALTALLWMVATVAAALREWDRPRLFFFHMALAETAVLGAFCAQDLALFVFFFDLMLVPFYFLIGSWGGRKRVQATTRLVIYTLVGSLLMLAGAVALGVLSTPAGAHVSFSLPVLAHRIIPTAGTQEWIFLLFAAAFLVKAPAFPFHGWMPDAYRAAPIPVLAVFSAVLSKVGMYGFLRIVLPLMPVASQHYQTLMIVIAVISILYGSVLAFSQDDVRLVVGYSSVAQLGFILLGIFSLDLEGKGAQGAVLQMVNHGLVVGPLFLIIWALSARAGGSESLARLGGIAFRAPVLAALFLIVALATLAMPGSSNFVGELLILFGAFSTKLVFGLVASAGAVLAAVYMIRVYQRSMHNRAGPDVESRDLTRWELAMLAPLVAVIVALGVYPQFVPGRTEKSTVRQEHRAALLVHEASHPALSERPSVAPAPPPTGRGVTP